MHRHAPDRERTWAHIAHPLACALAAPGYAQWPQWGEPTPDFTVEITGLADKSPTEEPPQLRHRPLGKDKFIPLGEDGCLALTTVARKGMTVHSKCKVTECLS